MTMNVISNQQLLSSNNNSNSFQALSHSSKLRPNRSDSFSGPDLKLFVKDVSDPHSNKRPITIRTWSTIKDVKDVVQKLLSIPPALQRLYTGPFMTSGVSLPNHRTLHDAGIYKNGQVLYLEIKGLPNGSAAPSSSYSAYDLSTLKHGDENDICISKAMFDRTPKKFKSIIKHARIGLACGIKPVLVLDGSGGTYFVHDVRKNKVAVFKPADEEPYAINNPRGYVRSGTCPSSSLSSSSSSAMGSGYGYGEEEELSMRKGIKPGEACFREVAAYLLDSKGFSSVPMTTLVEARHPAFHTNGTMLKLNQGGASVGSHSFIPLSTTSLTPTSVSNGSTLSNSTMSPRQMKKVGSCQQFIPSECTMDDISYSKLSTQEVHKIAILDIRILNADRNAANLLCRRKPEQPDTFELIPIDHGYCLRTAADVCSFDWCWLDWPQLKQPISQKTKEYILNLDIEKDVRMLKERLEIPNGALDYFRASNQLLQNGVKAGRTLYEIATLCCRTDHLGERPSKLESILSTAADIAKSAVDNGRWHHAAASRALEQQLTPNNGYLATRSFSKGVNGNFGRRSSTSMSIFKSASSVNFTSFVSSATETSTLPRSTYDEVELSSSFIDNNNDDLNKMPIPLAQFSGSDSSSDGDGVVDEKEEEEECEQWAADFIAGKLFEATTPISIPNMTRRQRSMSFARSDSTDSDDSSQLSKSPVGFWCVPPSASRGRDSLLEDTAVWSPHVSPNSSHKNIDIEGLDLGRDRAVTFNNPILPPSRLGTGLSSLSIGGQTDTRHICESDDEDEEIMLHLKNKKEIPESPLPPRPSGLMKRSQSYSAFSFKRITDSSRCDSNAARASPITTSSEEYEMYYQKYIKLLIDLETAPTINCRGSSQNNSTLRSSSSDMSLGFHLINEQ